MKSVTFSIAQRKRVSDIFGSISVAWFSAGVISPLLVGQDNGEKILTAFAVSVSMFLLFFVLSVEIA